jgi:hypothetical protein
LGQGDVRIDLLHQGGQRSPGGGGGQIIMAVMILPAQGRKQKAPAKLAGIGTDSVYGSVEKIAAEIGGALYARQHLP